MKGRSRVILAKLAHFGALLILAFAVSKVLELVSVPWWVQAALIFAGTKIGADGVSTLFQKERKFLYFEDYLRETFMFMVVAAIGILGIAAVEYYMGGVVWVPLLAAALVFIWR